MRGNSRIFACLCLVALFAAAGCCRVGGPPGYIDNLDRGDRDRVLGRYPGVPDDDGMVTVRVIGKGIVPENAVNKGQGIVLSERAAIADGYRQLAERIKGIYLETHSKVRMGQVTDDEIDLSMSTWLRGTRVTRIDRREHGITAAHMEVRVHFAPDHLLGNRFPRREHGYRVTGGGYK